MIAAEARALIEFIERRDSLKAHVDQLDGFQARDKQLNALTEALAPLTQAARELVRRNILQLDLSDRLPGLLSQLRRIRGVFAEDRDAFITHRSGFPDFERTATSFLDDLERQVRQAWRTHAQDQARQLDHELVSVLGSVPAYMDAVTKLRGLDREIAQLRDALPMEDVCRRFDQKVEERRKVWDAMGGGDFSPEILRFLRGATTGGVPLDHLTPAVRDWMDTHRLQGSFRITMSSSRI